MRNYFEEPVIEAATVVATAGCANRRRASPAAPAHRLRALLARVFLDEEALALTRIVLSKRYSVALVENRLRELESSIGKDHLPIVMRRSPFIIYAGSAVYHSFVARQVVLREARRSVLAAVSAAALGPLDPDVVERLVLHPCDAERSIELCQQCFGSRWGEALRAKAGAGGRFFLKSPCQQRRQIEALARSTVSRTAAVTTRQNLVAGLAEYVGPVEAERLVSLYLDKIRACSLATAVKRLAVVQSLGRPRARGWRTLPWSALFCEFAAFESSAKKMLGSARLRASSRTRIAALVGQQVAHAITSRCRLDSEVLRVEERLRLLQAEFGQPATVQAARQSPYIFAGSPKHFDTWLGIYRQRNARASGKQTQVQQIETILVEIFGPETGAEQARRRTLAPKNVLARIDQLKAEHPQSWQNIVRTRPSAVLSVSRAHFEKEVLAYLYDAQRDSDETSLPQAIRAIFDAAACAKVLATKRTKRLAAEMMMDRLSELEVLRKVERRLVPRNSSWILVAETRAWQYWLDHRKDKARLISSIQEHETDPARAEERIRTVADSYKRGRLRKVLTRLDALRAAQGEPAVADAVRFSWIALTSGSDSHWRRTITKERYRTVSVARTFERVAHRYHLAADPPLEVTKTGKLLVCPESRQHIRLFESPDGEIRVRRDDLSVLNLYLRLYCLDDPGVSRKEAYQEVEKLRAKNALKMHERMKLWMLRSYALASHDIELTKLLDQRKLRSEFSKGLPAHPDYGSPYAIDGGAQWDDAILDQTADAVAL